VLLAVDCGNTQIVVGVYQGEKLLCHFRFESDVKKTTDEYMVLLDNLLRMEGLNKQDIHHMALASVVPIFTEIFTALAFEYLDIAPLCVDHTTDTGIPILLDNPQEIGADRIVNAVAAYKLYGGPVIVVDFGTATTWDCVSEKGEYLGGAIAPGIEISQEALFTKAARLAQISIQSPLHAIGKGTAECLRSGIIWGFAGQVDGVVNKMQAEMGAATVISTGGLAEFISSYTKTIKKVEPFLTLEGLRLVYERLREN